MGRSALSCCALSQLGAGRGRDSLERSGAAKPFNTADRWDVDPAELQDICDQLVSQCGLSAAEALLVELGADDSTPVVKETFQHKVRERLGFRGDVGILFDILDPLGSGAVPLGVLKAQLVYKAPGARSSSPKKKQDARSAVVPKERISTATSSTKTGTSSSSVGERSSQSPRRSASPKLRHNSNLGTVSEQLAEASPKPRTKGSPKPRRSRSSLSVSSQQEGQSEGSPAPSQGSGKLPRSQSRGERKLPKAFSGGSALETTNMQASTTVAAAKDIIEGLTSAPENAKGDASPQPEGCGFNEGRASSFSPTVSPSPSRASLEPSPSDGHKPKEKRKRSKDRLNKLGGSASSISLGQASQVDAGAKSWGVDSLGKIRQGTRDLTSSGRQKDPLLVYAPVASGWEDATGDPLVDGVDMVRLRPLPYQPVPPDAGDDNRQRSFVYRDELFKIPMLPLQQLDPTATSARRNKQGKGWALVKSKAPLLQHTEAAQISPAYYNT